MAEPLTKGQRIDAAMKAKDVRNTELRQELATARNAANQAHVPADAATRLADEWEHAGYTHVPIALLRHALREGLRY